MSMALRQPVLDLLAAHPQGISSESMAPIVGASLKTTQRTLNELRHEGKAVTAKHGMGMLWALAEYAQIMGAYVDAEKKRRNRARREREQAANWAKLNEAQRARSLRARGVQKPRYEWPRAEFYTEPQPLIPSVWALAAAVGASA